MRENLAEFDRQSLPSYLESTNPANDHRYERLGFAKIGEFPGFVDGSVVSTMWRPAGSSGTPKSVRTQDRLGACYENPWLADERILTPCPRRPT